jgi:DEAD/DEAH box helicase domain-containing protein
VTGCAFDGPRTRPWDGVYGLQAVLERWRQDPAVAQNLVLDVGLPPVPRLQVDLPPTVHPAVRTAMQVAGIERLYSHQVQALRAAQQGHVVVATPTASGKSLCYNLPVLDALARDPEARAIYLFPTKALARDQEVRLRELMRAAGLAHGAVVYDGDTPPDARRAARSRAGVLLTNPDMLHAGVLPHHPGWARLFANLRFVVIDELHGYRGVFGSHLANVIRRLMRVARFHGASPRFLFSSATIGNPRAHAEALLGIDDGDDGPTVEAVTESGAPSGPRQVMVYNPPLVNTELGLRQSCVKATVNRVEDLVRARVPTIVFGESRNQVEVMLKYLRDRLFDDPSIPPDALQAYRSGYLPQTRRRIEQGLRDGDVLAVVATSALELGIDIGSLGAAVCAGHPGSMAALHQRFGRAGRRNEVALSLLVTRSAPLDQYLAQTPDLVLRAPIEQARIDPDNVEILLQHLKCSAFELPFEEGEGFSDVAGEPVADALGFLAEHGVLRAVPGRRGRAVFHWAADAFPANEVSLRSPSWDNFVIVERDAHRTLGEMDFRSTHTMLHEQAIYQHEGAQYQVEYLDFENHKAFVRNVRPDYYTTAMTHVKVGVLQEDAQDVLHGISVGLGEVNVVEKVVGYKKIRFHTHENVGYGEVDLPEMQMPTTAFWAVIPEAFVRSIGAPRAAVMDALAGLQSALHGVAAVGLMMDPRDLSTALVDEPDVAASDDGSDGRPVAARTGPRGYEPVMYFFDAVAGGVGLAPRLFDERQTWWSRVRRLIASCPCRDGCPSCVGPVLGPAPSGPRASDGPRSRSPLPRAEVSGVLTSGSRPSSAPADGAVAGGAGAASVGSEREARAPAAQVVHIDDLRLERAGAGPRSTEDRAAPDFEPPSRKALALEILDALEVWGP